MMWTVDGGVILWLGYWLFVCWIVWSYERRVREQRAEIEKLRRVIERRNLGVPERGSVTKTCKTVSREETKIPTKHLYNT